MNLMTDKIFREYDIRGIYPNEINERVAYRIAYAFAKLKKIKKVVVARDKRRESKQIFSHICFGLKDAGAKVMSLGVAGTPELSYAVKYKKATGAIMVTASHNPNGYTGLKIYDKNGLSLGIKTGLSPIVKFIKKNKYQEKEKPVKNLDVKDINVAEAYVKLSKNIIDAKKVAGLNVVMDASGGSLAGLLEELIIEYKLKAIKMNFVANDKYPDHGLNPLQKENQISASETVKKERADIGAIFDGDGDRLILLDDKGEFIEPYYVNCLLAEIVPETKKNIRILIDSRMPVGPSKVIRQNKARPVVCRSGTANFIKKMKKNKILFGCENSGHYFLNLKLFGKKTNYIISDSAIVLLLIAQHLKQNDLTLSQAIYKYRNKYFISGEKNYKIGDFDVVVDKLANEFSKFKQSSIDGLSVFGQEWFFNIRPSKTEPLMRLNVEGESERIVRLIRERVENNLKFRI